MGQGLALKLWDALVLAFRQARDNRQYTRLGRRAWPAAIHRSRRQPPTDRAAQIRIPPISIRVDADRWHLVEYRRVDRVSGAIDTQLVFVAKS